MRARLLLPAAAAVIALVVIGAVGYTVVLPRVRARLHAGWFEGPHLSLQPVVTGLQEPTFVVWPPDGSRNAFILERQGRVRLADGSGKLQPTPLLDLTDQVSTKGNEQGLLGLAFDPHFTQNGYVYISYTANDASYELIRYTVARDGSYRIDPASAETVLAAPKQSLYHNGGMLVFGPDGYLYASIGDDDHSDNAQDLGTLFGKILRLDVSEGSAGKPYTIPPSNPFVNTPGARGEIWAYGLRNPWRFSFDRSTGDLWIGDVGDATWEEIDFQPASSHGGENYGWPIYEGAQCMQSEQQCSTPGLVMPVVTYGHDMNCAVMGGYLYRGSDARGLVGSYLFGDLCTGGVFTIRQGATDPAHARVELGYQPIRIDSFGEDPQGGVYVSDISGGAIYKIVDGSLP